VSYHLRLLRAAGLVNARRSNADARDSYYRLDLDACADALRSSASAIHPALLGPWTGSSQPSDHWQLPRRTVLFACTGNSARSPIAEALLRNRSHRRLDVVSAGSHPKPRLHPLAVRALQEQYGIDIADQRPRHLDTLSGIRFDSVITLCDKIREVCPDFGDTTDRVHWSFPDPSAARGGHQPDYSDFVRTAADIDTRVRHLLATFALKEDSHDRT
jgi:protein-tyrosine-phosphatase